jgi:hypothetical protein
MRHPERVDLGHHRPWVGADFLGGLHGSALATCASLYELARRVRARGTRPTQQGGKDDGYAVLDCSGRATQPRRATSRPGFPPLVSSRVGSQTPGLHMLSHHIWQSLH